MSKEARNQAGQTEAEFLAAYDASRYQTPSVTADILLFRIAEGERPDYRHLPGRTLQVLLIRRGNHPEIGKWATPGGFVEFEEGLEQGARRELAEETGVRDVYLEQLYTFGKPHRDPRTRIISVAYLGLAQGDLPEVKAADDAAEAQWFDVAMHERSGSKGGTALLLKLTNGTQVHYASLEHPKRVSSITEGDWRIVSDAVGFDHPLIIACGLQRLRNKIEYTDIIFHLMPDYFTLTELQQCYEAVLGRKLSKANFRRKAAGSVVATEQYRHDAGHRPARLYHHITHQAQIKEVNQDEEQ